MKCLKYILSILFVFLSFLNKTEAKVIIIENEKIESFSEQDFQKQTQEIEWLCLLYVQEESINQNQFLFSSGSSNQNFSEEICPKTACLRFELDFQLNEKSKSHQRNGGRDEEFFQGNADLVNSWSKLFKESIPSTVRTNSTYLSAVSKQLAKYGDDVVFQFDRVLPKIKADDLPDLFKALDNPNSIDHVRSLVGDFENILGISLTKYTPNGLPKSAIDPPSTWANPLLDLPATHAPNFSNATAKTLSPGQKIYRVIGEGQNPAGGYWTYDLPTSKADVFGGTAVRPEWNSATKYVEYTIPEGGLKVWDGPAASQRLLDGIDDVSLPGGTTQIYVPEPYRQIGNAFDNLNPVDLNF